MIPTPHASVSLILSRCLAEDQCPFTRPNIVGDKPTLTGMLALMSRLGRYTVYADTPVVSPTTYFMRLMLCTRQEYNEV